ncbi:hypothetical protein [Streptomyces formicae]|uniref:Uncharacterized protein n=1 Tax=Streptomyces formicae TaxID=1616117 RepID=A0ABY3WKH7_9ACTN|nr:hypothetical protein [Streptomyces formicae]UNM11277.1 hypothetical protein J4032_06835 [Streptomyces formicae]
MDATSVGALLLCRAEPAAVRPPAALLREPLVLAPAGDGWSVLVPAGTPWRTGAEPVDRVLTGWATALAVGANWPALALWWDADRAGYTLAAGFRRTVGYVWLADGTPAGMDEAMSTFAARLGLDPVLDVQDLEPLTRPDADADARARLRGLVAVLSRTGLALPEGLAPGASAERLREAAETAPDAEPVEGHAVRRVAAGVEWAGVASGPRDEPSPRHEQEAHRDLAPHHDPASYRHPVARLLSVVQLAAGLPLVVRGIRRRSAGWTAAGAILLAHGAVGLACDRLRAPRPGR